MTLFAYTQNRGHSDHSYPAVLVIRVETWERDSSPLMHFIKSKATSKNYSYAAALHIPDKKIGKS